MKKLRDDGGDPKSMIVLMAVMAGLTVANLYYNQPLLEMISQGLGISHVMANLITVATQVGYAMGLLFIIPSGDLYSRRRIILCSMLTAALMSLVIALSQSLYIVWGASLLLDAAHH